MKSFLTILLLALFSLPEILLGSETYVANVPASHLKTVKNWLVEHPNYVPIEKAECECDTDLKEIRLGKAGRSPNPAYNPHYASGDFNFDGVKDFAVLLKNKTTSKPVAVVFSKESNGRSKGFPLEIPFLPSGVGLFYGPPRPRPYYLVVGTFGSEGFLVIPVGAEYRLFEPEH
jgi:hypothetical protein